ncbi:MAG: methyltransferase domain-containing protein [Saprospiraceae bacterium]|nr:methyltransferase domain-containing protein [Saprospiraceae bacterium]
MKPIFDRKGIPFFHQKTALEFQQDVYERYHEMVVRQAALHLADEIWGKYPFQAVFDFAETHYSNQEISTILELGCSVGRWIGTLAKRYPKATCWGIDYSYQMLKCANDFWVNGKEITIDLSDKGFAELLIKGEKLSNLHFGLAKAENLPFNENSQDLIVNSFLIDRLENPRNGLEEMYRVLKPNGKLIVISPLNFQKAEHWKRYFPPIKIQYILKKIGFKILEWNENIEINEPLDFRGNSVRWKCLGFVVTK